jgi:arsenate reductase
MAEGWARALRSDTIDPASAGTNPTPLNPLAVRAMQESGVDISAQRSKHVDELREQFFDLVVTVCESARESCPALHGGARVVHVGFDDPPHLAQDARSADEALPHYRRVRDQIRQFVESLPDATSAVPDIATTRKP